MTKPQKDWVNHKKGRHVITTASVGPARRTCTWRRRYLSKEGDWEGYQCSVAQAQADRLRAAREVNSQRAEG